MTRESGTYAAGSHVLVVEDDDQIRELIAHSLESIDCRVTTAANVADANRRLGRRDIDLVITDLGLPDASGVGTMHALDRDEIPVIVITGSADEDVRLACFEAGADDHLVKPYSPRELNARVNAVLRRSTRNGDRRSVDGLVIDRASRTVELDGHEVTLTRLEFDLLDHLAGHPDRTFSRQELLETVWSSHSEWQNPATVTEHVLRIRRKLASDVDHDWAIGAVRGVGYRFRVRRRLTESA